MYRDTSHTRFGHIAEWSLGRSLWRPAHRALLVPLLAATACLHSHKAALQRVPLVPAGQRPLAQRLAGADLVVPATLAKTERDWTYEEPCGILRSILYGCDNIPKAYQATLRRGAETWPVFYFKLGDLPHPAVGDSAVWVLHQGAVYHLLECAQHRALTSAYCNYDLAYVVESDDDVLPATTWQEVSALLHTLREPAIQP
ncbi:MAG TPA: hypothetical protein VM716_05390 [Gemmatimonadales bacterium]|nr:hypothetical protein [Gemmatimonadales bacterium]